MSMRLGRQPPSTLSGYDTYQSISGKVVSQAMAASEGFTILPMFVYVEAVVTEAIAQVVDDFISDLVVWSPNAMSQGLANTLRAVSTSNTRFIEMSPTAHELIASGFTDTNPAPGIQGIRIYDEGVLVEDSATCLNFTGDPVTATQEGDDGCVHIDITATGGGDEGLPFINVVHDWMGHGGEEDDYIKWE